MEKTENKWDDIFGSIDDSKFSPEQKEILYQGIYMNLPAQLYADPSLSLQQMENFRSMLETVIEALAEPNKRIVCTEYGPEELNHGFWSETNFAKYPERVCYIPENWDFADGPGITGRDILNLCEGDNLKAEVLFSQCDWQFPSTVLEEWDEEDYKYAGMQDNNHQDLYIFLIFAG